MSRRFSDFSEDLVVVRFLFIFALKFISLLYQTALPYCYKFPSSIHLIFILIPIRLSLLWMFVQPIEASLRNAFESIEVSQKRPQWAMQYNNEIKSSNWIFTLVKVSWTLRKFSNRAPHDTTIFVLFTHAWLLMAVAYKIEVNPRLAHLHVLFWWEKLTLVCIQVTLIAICRTMLAFRKIEGPYESSCYPARLCGTKVRICLMVPWSW